MVSEMSADIPGKKIHRQMYTTFIELSIEQLTNIDVLFKYTSELKAPPLHCVS